MTEEKPKDEPRKDRRTRDEADPAWGDSKEYVKKIAAVPKEELDEKLAEEKR